MYDLMIIGGGPAGLAASVYTARKRLNALLIRINKSVYQHTCLFS